MPLIPMKDNGLAYFFLCLMSISCIACSDTEEHSKESKRTDSLVVTLKSEAYNKPDSVFSIAKNLIKETKEPNNRAKVLLLMAGTQELMGNYDSSIATAREALRSVKNDPRIKAGIYNEIGVNYDYKSDYRNALDNYHKAQQYFEEAKDTIGYIRVRNNIGLIYQNAGDLQRAKTYFEECLQLSKEKKYANEVTMALSNLGSVENEFHHFSTALDYFKEVLKTDLGSGNESYISSSYHNVGEVYKNLSQSDSATYYLTRAIALKEKLDFKGSLSNSYKQYADLLIETNKLQEGEIYLNKAFQLSRETGIVDYLKDCFYLQSRLAEKRGDFKTAYSSLDSFHTIKDSISDARFRTELVISEKDHELAANEKMRQQQAKAFEKEKISFILFIVFLVAVSASLTYLLKKQKKLNYQLQLQKKQIEEGLMQRSQLLSFIAHEIRNPLGGIMGLTDLLLNNYPNPSQRELLEYQKKASAHLLALMNDVLDYQRLGSGKVELNSIRFNLRDVFYQVYALYQGEIREKHLNYDLDYDESIPLSLIGDPVRLTQVFSNLLNNAIKFTEKGTIIISARLVSQTSTTASLFFKVSDTGIGIPKEDQEKIFELYVQSSKNKSDQLGTGLGLSIVKNLLSMMHSKITLDSHPNSGTTFSFTITFEKA
jgi:signal transduction histidine kinase